MRFKEILVNTGIPLRQIRKQPIDTLARLYPKQIEELIKLTTKECLVCGKKFNSNHNKQSTCSYNCSLINEIRYRKKYSKKNKARTKKRYIDMKKLAKIVTR